MFQPGNPGGGRPKGAKNKLKKIIAVFEDLGLDPIADILVDLKLITDPAERIKLRMELLPYIYAKVKDKAESPETPTESVENADILMKQLAELSKPVEPTNVSDDA